MKTSKKFTPALFLLALAVALALGVVSQVGKVMAEDGVRDAEQTTHAALVTDDRSCEQREVETDEGYGLSRKEVRFVCH